MHRKLSQLFESFFNESGQTTIVMNRGLQRQIPWCYPGNKKHMQNWMLKNLHSHSEAPQITTRGYTLKFGICLMESWNALLSRDLHVAADLQSPIASAAKRETISFTSFVIALYEKDFELASRCTQLDMLPGAIHALEGGLTVSVGSVASAINAALVAKARLPEVHKVFTAFYNIPVSTASTERSLHQIETYRRLTTT